MTTSLVKLQARAMKALEARKDRGATAVEYGLMVALIAVVIIVAVTAVGDQLFSLFDGVQQELGGTPVTTP